MPIEEQGYETWAWSLRRKGHEGWEQISDLSSFWFVPLGLTLVLRNEIFDLCSETSNFRSELADPKCASSSTVATIVSVLRKRIDHCRV